MQQQFALFQLTAALSGIILSFSATLFLGIPLIVIPPHAPDPVPARLPVLGPVPALVQAVAPAPLLLQAALGAPAPHAVPVPAAPLDLQVHLDGDMTTGGAPAPSEFYLLSRNYLVTGSFHVDCRIVIRTDCFLKTSCFLRKLEI